MSWACTQGLRILARRGLDDAGKRAVIRPTLWYGTQSLWGRPPTGHAMPCHEWASCFGGAPCPNRTAREGMRWSACAWQRTVRNWRAPFIALLCGRTSFGWRNYGLPWRIAARSSPDARSTRRVAHSSFALWYCPEPPSKAASRRRRTAPSRWRSTRRMPFRGRHDREFESSPGDS